MGIRVRVQGALIGRAARVRAAVLLLVALPAHRALTGGAALLVRGALPALGALIVRAACGVPVGVVVAVVACPTAFVVCAAALTISAAALTV